MIRDNLKHHFIQAQMLKEKESVLQCRCNVAACPGLAHAVQSSTARFEQAVYCCVECSIAMDQCNEAVYCIRPYGQYSTVQWRNRVWRKVLLLPTSSSDYCCCLGQCKAKSRWWWSKSFTRRWRGVEWWSPQQTPPQTSPPASRPTPTSWPSTTTSGSSSIPKPPSSPSRRQQLIARECQLNQMLDQSTVQTPPPPSPPPLKMSQPSPRQSLLTARSRTLATTLKRAAAVQGWQPLTLTSLRESRSFWRWFGFDLIVIKSLSNVNDLIVANVMESFIQCQCSWEKVDWKRWSQVWFCTQSAGCSGEADFVIARLSVSQIRSWVALSSLVVCRPSVPHRWHLHLSPLYDVLDHTNQIFSVRIWSWQRISVIISTYAECRSS